MNFEDSPQEAAFRAEVRDWLAAHATDYINPLPADISLKDFIGHARSWQRKKSTVGYAAIGWPKSAGGLDGTPMQEVIFADEEARYHVPVGPFVSIGTGLVLPTFRKHATPEQVERFARPTLEGEVLWCQLFSEPAAGSDLAGLRMRAVKDGDDWVINGQKVWNSWAHVADWGILVVRTDPDVVKHKGLTYFIVDMKTPGIEVRPIRQPEGESEFNEVFFTDVRIPDSSRIGAVGDGWKVVMTTLMNERLIAVSESSALPTVVELLQANEACASTRPATAAAARLRIAQLYAQEQGLKNYRMRQLTQISRGEPVSSMSVLSKLVYGRMLQELSALALDQQGLAGAAGNSELTRKFRHGYFWGAAMRIAGGTDEILRNQIAERVLGLPGDIRLDKDVAFSKLPSGR